MFKLLALAKLESLNFEASEGLLKVKPSKAHFVVKLHALKESSLATLTVLDCGTQG